MPRTRIPTAARRRATALPIPPKPTIPTRVCANSLTGTVPSVNESRTQRPSYLPAAAQWKPRVQNATAPNTQSAIGSAWTPRELVRSVPPASSPGVRLAPTPTAAEWAQRSAGCAASATAFGTPQPK